MRLTGAATSRWSGFPARSAALATVALIYALGRRMGGREVGLASALVLCSLGFFVGEMRQASNDGPLALFTTLALDAAWRGSRRRSRLDAASPVDIARSRAAVRVWALCSLRRWDWGS